LKEKLVSFGWLQNLSLSCHAADYMNFGISFAVKLLHSLSLRLIINSPFLLLF